MTVETRETSDFLIQVQLEGPGVQLQGAGDSAIKGTQKHLEAAGELARQAAETVGKAVKEAAPTSGGVEFSNHLYPGAKITSIRAFVRGGAVLSDIVYALLLGRLLSDPVDIFNLSFSVDASYEVCPACGEASFPVDERPAMHLLFEHLRTELSDRPILIAAAGNSGGRVATPADLLGVIAVGSTGDSPRDSPSPEPSYTKIPEYFVLADGGSKAEPVGSTGGRHSGARFGTSYATAVVTGLLSGLLANGAAYGIPDTRDELRWGLANANLRRSASWDFQGYDSDVHGLGVLRALAGPEAGGAATGSLRF